MFQNLIKSPTPSQLAQTRIKAEWLKTFRQLNTLMHENNAVIELDQSPITLDYRRKRKRYCNWLTVEVVKMQTSGLLTAIKLELDIIKSLHHN